MTGGVLFVWFVSLDVPGRHQRRAGERQRAALGYRWCASQRSSTRVVVPWRADWQGLDRITGSAPRVRASPG